MSCFFLFLLLKLNESYFYAYQNKYTHCEILRKYRKVIREENITCNPTIQLIIIISNFGIYANTEIHVIWILLL